MESDKCDVKKCSRGVYLGWHPAEDQEKGLAVCKYHWEKHCDDKDEFSLWKLIKMTPPKMQKVDQLELAVRWRNTKAKHSSTAASATASKKRKRVKAKHKAKAKKGSGLGVYGSLCKLFNEEGIGVSYDKAKAITKAAKDTCNLSQGHFKWYKKKYTEQHPEESVAKKIKHKTKVKVKAKVKTKTRNKNKKIKKGGKK